MKPKVVCTTPPESHPKLEKGEPMLARGAGVGSGTDELLPVVFTADHQLPSPDDAPPSPPNVDPWKGKLEGGQSLTVSKKFGGF